MKSFIDFCKKAKIFIFFFLFLRRTDNLIQATIRRHFAECTVLTVAHRLNTIFDSDRIMVLEAGNIIEFDTPARLYENTMGAFRKLVDDAGLDFERLTRTAIWIIHEWENFIVKIKINLRGLTCIDVWSDLWRPQILQPPKSIKQITYLQHKA